MINPTLLARMYQPPNDISGADPSNYQTNEDVTAPAPNPPINISDRMKALYHPTLSANDAYMQQLKAAPNRADYPAGGLRRVLGAIAGMNSRSGADAFGTSSGIANAPYNQAEQDWEARAKNFGEAAKIEDTGNKDKRALAEKQIDQEITAGKEKDIFNTKVADLERKIRDSEGKAAEWEKQFGLNQANQAARDRANEARNQANEARIQLGHEVLAETIRKHDQEKTENDKRHKETEDKLQIQRDYNKARLAGQDVSSYIIDNNGEVTQKMQSHRGPAGAKLMTSKDTGDTWVSDADMPTFMKNHPDGKEKGQK